MRTPLFMAAALFAVLPAAPVFAQESQTPHAVRDSGGAWSGVAVKPYLSPPDAARFAKQIESDLAAKGAHVAIVFRAGRPRSKMPKGISYTHAAFFVYGDIKGGDGQIYKGYAVYNLYQGDGPDLPRDRSYLHQDFPVDFVGGSQADDVGVIIPSPEMQRRIYDVIESPAYERLHVPAYSVIANPLDARYQNCTEFVLDVIAAAAWQTDDYAQIKADLKAHFQPTVVQVNAFERLFGPMMDSAVKTDDQSGPLVTATYESVAAFMTDNGLMAQTYRLYRSK
jgi:hypothetical protein